MVFLVVLFYICMYTDFVHVFNSFSHVERLCRRFLFRFEFAFSIADHLTSRLPLPPLFIFPRAQSVGLSVKNGAVEFVTKRGRSQLTKPKTQLARKVLKTLTQTKKGNSAAKVRPDDVCFYVELMIWLSLSLSLLVYSSNFSH